MGYRDVARAVQQWADEKAPLRRGNWTGQEVCVPGQVREAYWRQEQADAARTCAAWLSAFAGEVGTGNYLGWLRRCAEYAGVTWQPEVR